MWDGLGIPGKPRFEPPLLCHPPKGTLGFQVKVIRNTERQWCPEGCRAQSSGRSRAWGTQGIWILQPGRRRGLKWLKGGTTRLFIPYFPGPILNGIYRVISRVCVCGGSVFLLKKGLPRPGLCFHHQTRGLREWRLAPLLCDFLNSA